eukprot:gene25851-biopygen16532
MSVPPGSRKVGVRYGTLAAPRPRPAGPSPPRAAASPGPRDHRFSPSARFMLRMAGTNTCVYSGSKANAPGPRTGRGRSDAGGGHLVVKKTGFGARWHPIGVGYAPLAAPPGSRDFKEFDGSWRLLDPSGPQLPPAPQLPQAPGIANSARARVLGSEWRTRIPAYTAAPRQMHRAPGLAGADRTQK